MERKFSITVTDNVNSHWSIKKYFDNGKWDVASVIETDDGVVRTKTYKNVTEKEISKDIAKFIRYMMKIRSNK